MASLVDLQFLIKYIKHSTDVARLTLRNGSGHLDMATAHWETEATKLLQMKKI